MSATIQTDINSNGVAVVTLNRPQKHNAFDDAIITELQQTFDDIDQNPNVKVMVLAAQGKSFSAGADLSWMKRMADYSYQENFDDAQALATMLRTLDQMSKPTIAKVQGAAYGGAVGLVSCCDMAVGTRHYLAICGSCNWLACCTSILPYHRSHRRKFSARLGFAKCRCGR